MPPYTGEITVKRVVQTGAALGAASLLTLAGASVAMAAPATATTSASVSPNVCAGPIHITASHFSELQAPNLCH